ncbi:MAG: hypothetical protein QOE86_3364, partial [Solirubrobacteraceae bacterium]|nr:hypothetical protein [Solirubrobacteraceae bacterium]
MQGSRIDHDRATSAEALSFGPRADISPVPIPPGGENGMGSHGTPTQAGSAPLGLTSSMTPQVQAWTVIRRQGAAEALAVPAPALVLPDITAGVYAPPRHDEVAGRSGAAEAGHRGARPGRVLACADLVSAGLAITLMSLVAWAPPAAAVFAGLPLLLIATHAAGLYGHDELRLKRSTLDETPALLQLSGLFTLSVAILHPIPFGRAGLGVELATLWAAMFVAVLLTRLAARALIARAAPVERCLMVSEPARAQRLRDRFASATHGRSAVVATLRSAGFAGISDAQDVRDLVAELEADRILVAPTTEDPAEIDGIVRMCRAAGVPLNLLPAVFEAVGPVAEIEDVDGLMLVGVPPFGLARGALGIKRTMDVVFVFAGCLLLAPLMLAIAAAVRLDSRGPVFFRQTRVGRDGRRFRIWKFRSMVEGADEQKLG